MWLPLGSGDARCPYHVRHQRHYHLISGYSLTSRSSLWRSPALRVALFLFTQVSNLLAGTWYSMQLPRKKELRLLPDAGRLRLITVARCLLRLRWRVSQSLRRSHWPSSTPTAADCVPATPRCPVPCPATSVIITCYLSPLVDLLLWHS